MSSFLNVAACPRILAILAHPDDESFGMGGTLALYADCGAVVSLVCATGGEAGMVEAVYMKNYATIAELREAELRCAAEKLNLSNVYLAGYRDSGMPGSPDNTHPDALIAAPLDEVAMRMVSYIRLLRPHVVLTFDPIGGYRHPDHIAVHHATVQAFYAAGYPNVVCPNNLPPYRPQKLYFHVFPRGFLRLVVKLMPLFGKDPRQFGRNGDIDLVSLAGEDFPIHARIDYLAVDARKREAAQCHASQGGGRGLISGVLEWAFRIAGSTGHDSFMRAYPPPTQGLCERDVFEGVDLNR